MDAVLFVGSGVLSILFRRGVVRTFLGDHGDRDHTVEFCYKFPNWDERSCTLQKYKFDQLSNVID